MTADLVLACGEAAANSIEHAYRNGDGVVDVEIVIASGPAVVASVRDRGTWRTEGAADEVELHPDEGGTMVTMRRLLTGEGRP